MLSRPPGSLALLVSMQIQHVVPFKYVKVYENDPYFIVAFQKLQLGNTYEFEMKDGLIFKDEPMYSC